MRSDHSMQELYGKELYVQRALEDNFGEYVENIRFIDYLETGELLFHGTNIIIDIPCQLKTDGRVLHLEIDKDYWVPVKEYELNSYIPKEEEPVFIDHLQSLQLVQSFGFSKEELEYLAGVLLTEQTLTKREALQQLENAKHIFSSLPKETKS